MAESGWKRFWSETKAPGRAPTKRPSGLWRLWDSIKPPPAVESRKDGVSTEERRRRTRLVLGTVALVAVAAVAWEVYQYIAAAPMRAERVLQDGMQMIGSGDYTGAVARFTKAVSIWPRMANGYLERGLAYRNMNQIDAATADFERAIREDPSLAPAHTALGEIYREKGDLTGAMNEFTLSINSNPSIDAYYQRGQVHEALGQHQQAIQDYDDAIHEEPDAPYVYRARAMAWDAIGNHEKAEQDRRSAIQNTH